MHEPLFLCYTLFAVKFFAPRESESLSIAPRPFVPHSLFMDYGESLVFPLMVRTGSGMSPHQRENPIKKQVSVTNRLYRTVEYIT